MTFSLSYHAPLAGIVLGDRLRPVDPARVEALAASMSEIGLQQPIVVRSHPGGDNRLQVIAGAHRYEAAVKLGWTEIAVILLDVDDASARIVEIDENLIRNELSALEFAEAVAERKRIYEELHPQAKWGGDRSKARENEQELNLSSWSGFAKDAAKRTGLSIATFKNAAGLIKRLSPEAIALLRSSPIADNGAALKKLSKIEDPSDQLAVARALASGGAKSLKAAMAAQGLIPIEEAVDPAVAEKLRNEGRFQQWLAASDAKQRRKGILAIFDHATAGELPALCNELVKHLPQHARLKLKPKLDASLEGYEAEPADEEAA